MPVGEWEGKEVVEGPRPHCNEIKCIPERLERREGECRAK
jgi:hypothetical protein